MARFLGERIEYVVKNRSLERLLHRPRRSLYFVLKQLPEVGRARERI
jgi:hypothetical protein